MSLCKQSKVVKGTAAKILLIHPYGTYTWENAQVIRTAGTAGAIKIKYADGREESCQRAN